MPDLPDNVLPFPRKTGNYTIPDLVQAMEFAVTGIEAGIESWQGLVGGVA